MLDDRRSAHDDSQAGPSPGKRLIRMIGAELRMISSEVFDRVRSSLRRFSNDRDLLVWVLALAIGCSVAYAALGFRMLLGITQWLWLGTASEETMLAAARAAPWYALLLAPIVGGLIVGFLLERFVPTRRAHGVADVIEARALKDCKIDPNVGIWSAFISAISLGFGASAGREGPVVHLGAAIASFIEDRFKLDASARRTLLACGVGAAVSASFNAPIAGVLFAHEVILAHYALRAFVPIVIASVAGAVLVRLHLGNFPAFMIPTHDIASFFEFPAFVLLGLTCAVVAILFQLSLTASEKVASRIDIPLWLRPAIGGVALGVTAMFLPEILGVGYGATDLALQQMLPLWLMLTLIVAKTAATAITLASRFGGGIFSPSLYLGAMTGGAFGLIASSAFPDLASSQGLYALLGMGAVAGAVLGAPISTTMIVFELTGGYEMTIALLLTVSIAHGATQAVLGTSWFHWQLMRRGLSVQDGPHKEIMRHMTVAKFMVPLADGEQPPVPTREMPVLQASETLEDALRAFDASGSNRIPVVSSLDGTRVIGWAHRVAALSALNRELIARSEEEHR
ncbi:MAG: chloride channel protein [Hyphomicrobiaceae bacterium]